MGSSGSVEFALTKTCESNVLCTVVSSSLEAIPAGTRIDYTVNGDGSDGLAYPTIETAVGRTSGMCDWNHPEGPILARCTFDEGTGAFAGFHLSVDVTVVGDADDPASVWHWDGTYAYADDSVLASAG